MKVSIFCYSLLLLVLLVSCTKGDDSQQPNTPDNSVIGRLQKSWQLISITQLQRNGPGRFQYVGTPADYMLFSRDSIYTYVQGIHDNVKYRMLSDSSTFVFSRGSAAPQPSDTLHINKLTNHLLVFQGLTNSGDIGIDSLRR